MKAIPHDRVRDLVMMAKSLNYEELSILLAAYVAEMQRETVIEMCNDDESFARDMFEDAQGMGATRYITGGTLFANGIEMFRDLEFDEEMRRQFARHNLAQFFEVKLTSNNIIAS